MHIKLMIILSVCITAVCDTLQTYCNSIKIVNGKSLFMKKYTHTIHN